MVAAILLLLSLIIALVVSNVPLSQASYPCPLDNNIFAIGRYPAPGRNALIDNIVVGAIFGTPVAAQGSVGRHILNGHEIGKRHFGGKSNKEHLGLTPLGRSNKVDNGFESSTMQNYAFYQASLAFRLNCTNGKTFPVTTNFLSPYWFYNISSNGTGLLQQPVGPIVLPAGCDNIAGFTTDVPVLSGNVASTIAGTIITMRAVLTTFANHIQYVTLGPLTTINPGTYDLRCVPSGDE